MQPWQGPVEDLLPDTRPEYDTKDYLGLGSFRVNGTKQNPKYEHIFVFDNDFMDLLPDTPSGAVVDPHADDLLLARSVAGRCRVVCSSCIEWYNCGNECW